MFLRHELPPTTLRPRAVSPADAARPAVRNAAKFALVLTGLLALAACGEQEAPAGPPPDFEFGIEVNVVDQGSNPIARVPVLIDGQVVGYTDRDGNFAGRLVDKPNTPVLLGVGDMDGYRYIGERTVEEHLQVKRDVSGAPQGLPLSLRATVQSLKSDYLLWVKLTCDETLGGQATCAGLPIKIDGEVVARTNDEGAAHAAFEGIIGRKARVTIDTPAYDPAATPPRMFEPRNPVYELDLGIETTVFVLEDTFVDPAAKRAQEARPTRTARPAATSKAATKRPRPATKKKAAPKQDPQIINLW